MALIRCPNCGHQVLSVATLCPSCSTRLTPDPNSVGSLNELEPCPRCEGLIVRGTKRCPHCGHAAGRWRVARAVGSVLVVAIAVVLFLVVVPGLDRSSTTSTPTPPVAPSPQPIGAALDTATRPAAESTAVTTPGAASTPQQPTPIMEAPSTAPSRGRVLWTNEWANVRGARSRGAPILRVVRPGTPVSVGDRQRGWWAVFEGDSVSGYIAASLLDSTPPAPGN